MKPLEQKDSKKMGVWLIWFCTFNVQEGEQIFTTVKIANFLTSYVVCARACAMKASFGLIALDQVHLSLELHIVL